MDDAEFAAALAAQVASVEETPAEEPEAPSDEATAEEPEPQATLDLEPEPEADEPDDEPDERVSALEAYLAKYGGDIEKAYEASNHAQAKIGQQAQELGELRRMVQEMYDRPQPQQQQSAPIVPSDMQEAIEQNPAAVAQWALQNNQAPIYEAAMASWYDEDPRAATRFEIGQAMNTVANTVVEQVAPTQEAVRQQQQAQQLAAAHRELQAVYPDFQQVLGTATSDEVAGIDRNLLDTVMQANPKAALEMTYRWVAAERARNGQLEQAQKAENTRQEKRQAAVVTADNTTPQAAEPSVMDRLKASMLDPEPQSVRHGLTH